MLQPLHLCAVSSPGPHELPEKESTSHETGVQIFLKMKSKCPFQVLWLGIEEGSSPGRRKKTDNTLASYNGFTSAIH